MIPRKPKDVFWYWMNERHGIWVRRFIENQEYPWSTDPIFQKYSFCNVFRELDRVTQWIAANWRTPYALHQNLWFGMAVARLINWPPTLKAIGFPEYRTTKGMEGWMRHAIKVMHAMAAQGNKVYTGAYMLRGDIQRTELPNDKPTYTMKILRGMWEERSAWMFGNTFGSLAQAWTWFNGFPGMGPFLSYEVVTDLRWTRYLQNAPDIMSWANAGPGAIRGLNRIAGRPLAAATRQGTCLEEMRALLQEANNLSGEPLNLDLFYERGLPFAQRPMWLEMRDIEHSLCEFDKYSRVLLGEGRPRSTYHRYHEQSSRQVERLR